MLRTWRNDLRVGVPEIDGDHRRICDALDALSELINGCAQPTEFFEKLLELADSMAEHFSREEQMMHDIGYNGADSHLKNHYEALRILSALVFSCEKNSKLVSDETLMLIKVWTMEHIQNYDQPLANAIISMNINSVFSVSNDPVIRPSQYYA